MNFMQPILSKVSNKVIFLANAINALMLDTLCLMLKLRFQKLGSGCGREEGEMKSLGLDMPGSSKKANGQNGAKENDEIGERQNNLSLKRVISVCEEGPGVCSMLLTLGSLVLIFATLPLSLYVVVKVVQVGNKQNNDTLITISQEYERAVIFRLGRLLTGGARGPGVFFIIPCVDVFEKIDMRTMTYEIHPQAVCIHILCT